MAVFHGVVKTILPQVDVFEKCVAPFQLAGGRDERESIQQLPAITLVVRAPCCTALVKDTALPGFISL